MWQEGSRIHFQTKVVESNNIVIGSRYSLNYKRRAGRTKTYSESRKAFLVMNNFLAAEPLL
jgi:hypothetical protein